MYTLDSAEARAFDHPETFAIPPRATRASLRPGDHAKLVFRFNEGGVERMWVKVEGRDSGIYIGTLANHPASHLGLVFGERVVFGPQHVVDFQINRAPETPEARA